MVENFISLAVGAISTLTIVVIYVMIFPEKTEKIIGWLLGLFNFGIRKFRQHSIRSSIQGRISTFARSMNDQVNGIMPYNIRLSFVKEINRTELDIEGQVVIVRIRDNLEDDRNLVNSMMAFCSLGVVPQARQFLSKSMNAAIDVTVTRKLLNDLKHYSALQYLYGEMLPDSGEESRAREEFCRIFDALDESGLFTRVFLEEIRDFGARISSRYPTPWHNAEAIQFAEYVYEFATRPAGYDMEDIGYDGTYISTALVPVGTLETMVSGGEEPYLRHIQRLKESEFQRAYIIARGAPSSGNPSQSASINMALRVAKSVSQQRLGTVGRTIEFYAPDSNGSNRKNVLIKINLA
ncbi:MAG: hypothetical protein F4X34_08040 [Chloroflexi bacterium]|nr:hypothetical protein [Chloroflexota bacterium]